MNLSDISIPQKRPCITQRRHASSITGRTHIARSQPQTSTLDRTLPQNEAILRLNQLSQAPPESISLSEAWDVFSFLRDNPGWVTKRNNVLLRFAERVCDRIEMLCDDGNQHTEFMQRKEQFREIAGFLHKRYSHHKDTQFVVHLYARSKALLGQTDAAMKILDSLRKRHRHQFSPAIAKTYQTIYSTICYYHDAVHVVHFLERYWVRECFIPPWCFSHGKDESSPSALSNRHPRLLHILSKIDDPAAHFEVLERNHERSKVWPDVAALLFLAYCHHQRPLLALAVHDGMERLGHRVDDRLKIRLARVLAHRFLDDAH